MLNIMRNTILAIGWPILIIGSVYLFIKGRAVYTMIKGSLIGKISKALVFSMLIEMYSLGIVSTVYMFCDEKGVYWVVPIFIIWFITFIWSMKVLIHAQKEATGQMPASPKTEENQG